jgi:hypothetical protein
MLAAIWASAVLTVRWFMVPPDLPTRLRMAPSRWCSSGRRTAAQPVRAGERSGLVR